MTASPIAWLGALRQRLQLSQERRLVWVQGSASFTRQWARTATAAVAPRTLLWVGLGEDATMAPEQALQYLGQEYSVLVWDGRGGLHPNGFAALAGTLRGGGVLILLTPEAAAWPRFEDPDYHRLASVPGEKYFIRRLAQLLAAAPEVLALSPGAPLPALPDSAVTTPLILPTADQQRALAAILRVRQGHRRRPLVITADRGRGKSAIMGIAAGQLIAQQDLTIIVTAARPAALASFWRHAGALPHSVSRGLGTIRYLTPAELIESRPAADLVLVDEAAAIPLPMLKTLLQHYARLVFASTVHGYEGSGRGFALRFRDDLTAQAPGWQALSMTQPVRWAASDPLEPLLRRLLLLDADLPPLGRDAATGAGELAFVPWPRSLRAGNEQRLTEVFGLLVNAHYQTTPDDLRLLLDDQDSHCWLALQAGAVVGVVWAMAEGGLDADLAAAVRSGRRRIRGHLLPQALAAYGGDATAAELRYWRLVRIAVHPAHRQQGLGRRLVSLVVVAAAAAGADVVGTSFGASRGLVSFWRRCGLQGLRLGLRRDAASGAHSMMLGLGLTGSGKSLCQRQRDRFGEHWPTLLTTDLQTLEPALVWLLSRDWCPPDLPWSRQDALEVADFAHGYRSLALSRLPLQRLTWSCRADLPVLLGEEQALWCRAVIQQVSEHSWQAEGLVSGRKEAYRRLQQTAAGLLAAIGGGNSPDSGP